MNEVRILGKLLNAQLDSLSEQSFPLGVTGKWIPTAVFITNVNVTGVAVNFLTYDAPGAPSTGRISGGGTIQAIGSPDDVQNYNLIYGGVPGTGKSKVRTSNTAYLKMSSALAAGATGDVYILGVEL